jgi:predicted AlkP superfamily phosphohydrolase/phosphomutase
MRTIVTRAALIAAILFLTGACASSADWGMWRSHSTHFASGEHGFYSMRNNKDGSNPKVYLTDIEASRQENWWGLYAITVSPSQIFQN